MRYTPLEADHKISIIKITNSSNNGVKAITNTDNITIGRIHKMAIKLSLNIQDHYFLELLR